MSSEVVRLVEEPAKARVDLSTQIDALVLLVNDALGGTEVEQVDSVGKLVGSLAQLINAQTKAEESVSKSDLQRFILGMTDVISACVASPEERADVQRGWRRVMGEMAG